jgi:ABC-2 type transport system permease protein
VTEALAFVRSGWLSATSYRVNAVLSMGSFVAMILPFYFVAGAIEPLLAGEIASEGGDYFAFLVLGQIALRFLVFAMMTLPGALSRGIGNGTLEALLATPIRLPTLMFGLVSYDLVWVVARALLFLAAGLALGVTLAFGNLPAGLLIFVMLVAAHIPIGLIAASCVLVFRNATPLPGLVLSASALLGGAYYPAHVVPSWLQYVSGALPMTYGLRALRETLLGGASAQSVMPDLLMLGLFIAILLPLGVGALRFSLRYARTSGSLTHY